MVQEGPLGLLGATGATGATGPEGATGPDGATGPAPWVVDSQYLSYHTYLQCVPFRIILVIDP